MVILHSVMMMPAKLSKTGKRGKGTNSSMGITHILVDFAEKLTTHIETSRLVLKIAIEGDMQSLNIVIAG